jgi:murein DD-endopeptidase MepM/ murein hydrolase activator NlpD
VSFEVDGVVARARLAADRAGQSEPFPADEREGLERLASEFESMLLVQMLRDMRRSARWDDEDEGDSLGAEAMFETLDVELASHLARAQGLGLTNQLLSAFDRTRGPAADIVGTAALPPSSANVQPAVMGSAAGPTVTSAFGLRQDPITGETRFHRGVDLRAAYGQEVVATDAGRVVFSGVQGGYGTTVLIEHADGTRTRYAHLSNAAVREGETVGAGQPVGRAGSSGRATGPHLHFERTDRQGRPIDPMGQGR